MMRNPFPDKRYNIIYADPPWTYHLGHTKMFEGWNIHNPKRKMQTATAFYKTMSTYEICRLPVENIADKNCLLFLWTTNPSLPDALKVIEAWGFSYLTVGFVWIKKNPNSQRLKLGLGYYTRPSAEMCLLAKKGTIRPIDRSVYQVHQKEVGRHSEKPDLFRIQIVKLCGDLPRIELFSRHKIPGWDQWGNQVPDHTPVLEAFIETD
jgi:N6-adenosine-specific RNA methylase IME4